MHKSIDEQLLDAEREDRIVRQQRSKAMRLHQIQATLREIGRDLVDEFGPNHPVLFQLSKTIEMIGEGC